MTINIARFSIFVDKSDNILILKKDNEPFKTYAVATGKNNSTPVGTFEIVDKMIQPPWTKPGVGIVMPDSEDMNWVQGGYRSRSKDTGYMVRMMIVR